jgi:hypothetical protein
LKERSNGKSRKKLFDCADDAGRGRERMMKLKRELKFHKIKVR